MSYGFNMGFIAVMDKLEAFEKCQDFANSLVKPEVAKSFIIDNEYFLRRRIGDCNDGKLNIEQNFALRGALWELFTVHAVFWGRGQYSLLGILGDSWPEELQGKFHTTQCFQNSCDQDYDFESWNERIPLFKYLKEQVMEASDEKIVQQYKKSNSFDEDETELSIDYIRKVLLYERIFTMLDLDSFLYKDTGTFERITLSGLATQEKYYALEGIAMNVLMLTD